MARRTDQKESKRSKRVRNSSRQPQMKIAFVIEYFRPMGAGGSGWSTYYLAKDLAANNQEVVVLTPNYGAKKTEFDDGIRILRFPFYLKLKNFNQLPGNFALTNPFWILWTVINLFLLIKKENPDVIHVQGKYSVPPAVIANLFFKKPLVATVRDYLVICNYGITEFLWILIVGLSNYKIIEIGYQPNFILTWLFSFFVIFSFTFFLLFQYRVHIKKLE